MQLEDLVEFDAFNAYKVKMAEMMNDLDTKVDDAVTECKDFTREEIARNKLTQAQTQPVASTKSVETAPTQKKGSDDAQK